MLPDTIVRDNNCILEVLLTLELHEILLLFCPEGPLKDGRR